MPVEPTGRSKTHFVHYIHNMHPHTAKLSLMR